MAQWRQASVGGGAAIDENPSVLHERHPVAEHIPVDTLGRDLAVHGIPDSRFIVRIG